MVIRIARSDDDDDEIAALDAQCFAPDEAYPVGVTPLAECWIARDGDEPIGYAVVYEQTIADERCTYLDRYGVLPSHAGRGVGKRLLRAWLRWSARSGAAYAWTYTVPANASSINALIGAGFRASDPPWRTSAGYCLWRKDHA